MPSTSRAARNDSARLRDLRGRLAKAQTEEEVKAAWARCLALDYDTGDDMDLYTPQVLFEFKHDADLSQRPRAAAVLAQVLYYLRRLKFGVLQRGIPRGIPPAFALVDRHHLLLGTVADWRELFSDREQRFDWDLQPSSPDPRLVATVIGHPALKALQVFAVGNDEAATTALRLLDRWFAPQAAFDFGDRKAITEDNFEDVFSYWNQVFGEAVRNGFKSSRYFMADIQRGRTQVVAQEGRVYFQVGPEDVRIKKILADDHQRFWQLYDKVDDAAVLRGIVAKIDRLTDEVQRRIHGEFFTPLPFARKALEYLERTLGARWWERGDVRLWDMAAGTGNLQYHLPAAAWPCLHLSTLYREDVEHLERLYPQAHVFQYDYLNDDVGNVFAGGVDAAGQGRLDGADRRTWKLPKRLRDELANPAMKWVVLINPPFATAQQGGASGANKSDVSMTEVRAEMHAQDLGETSRELFSQFLFRIRRELAGKQAWLGLFSKIKYLNATNDQRLRDHVFRYAFGRGFLFSSAAFDGTSRTNAFPVGFLLWNLANERALEGQRIHLDVFNLQVQKTGVKRVRAEHRDRFLSKWIARPAATTVFPPFSSAITVKLQGPDLRDRVADGFVASLMCKGNDLQNQNMTALLSGPYASAGGHSVTPGNFEQAMVVHAVRRLPKAEWHNDRDPFLQPEAELPPEFVNDCVAWSLFAPSNATVAMADVAYAGQLYQVQNHLFPYRVQVVRGWPCGDADMALQLHGGADRFAARWLAGKALSAEAQAVLDSGAAVWRAYFALLPQLRQSKFKISTWDAGWWQVRMALADRDQGADALAACKAAHDGLKAKLLPQISELGFLA